jgi:hypothetical protein
MSDQSYCGRRRASVHAFYMDGYVAIAAMVLEERGGTLRQVRLHIVGTGGD